MNSPATASTAGYTLYWLIRVMPEHVICLQSGRFDEADRIFRSVISSWGGVLTGGADVKELTPEFYDTDRKRGGGRFLVNAMNLTLGATEVGEGGEGLC